MDRPESRGPRASAQVGEAPNSLADLVPPAAPTPGARSTTSRRGSAHELWISGCVPGRSSETMAMYAGALDSAGRSRPLGERGDLNR
jgi:hypothetical protein